MLRKIIINCTKPTTIKIINRLAHNAIVVKSPTLPHYEIVESEQNMIENPKDSSVLDECNEDLSHVAPYLKPTFNFAAYINKSEVLQELFKLGVDLYKLEKNVKCVPFILSLDFEKNVKNHVLFLYDLGLEKEQIGNFITRNPFIFKEDLDNLQVRINYLKSKRFDEEMVRTILERNPNWLSLSVQEIDEKLGWFQKYFHLNGSEVRLVAVKNPKLITYDQKQIKLNYFVIKEEMGFSEEEVKEILKAAPTLFRNSQNKILPSFLYLHKIMKIPSQIIMKFPNALTCREFRLKQRHLFLEKLGRVQYNPKKPNYVSLYDLVTGDDAHFATEIAKSSIQAFNAFLKTF